MDRAADGGRWWTGALPILAAVIVLSGIAFWLVPGGRDQFDTSFTRAPQPSVAIYLNRPGLVGQCRVDGHRMTINFSVRTRDLDQQLAYSMVSSPNRTGRGGNAPVAGRSTGTVPSADGVHTFSRKLRVPEVPNPYHVTITLADRPENLLIRCPDGGTQTRNPDTVRPAGSGRGASSGSSTGGSAGGSSDGSSGSATGGSTTGGGTSSGTR